MTTLQQLEQVLSQLQPTHITIEDESALHAGHAGNTGGGHFRLLIVSPEFTGLSLLQRHRKVYDAASDLMSGAIHALSIKALTPDEYTD